MEKKFLKKLTFMNVPLMTGEGTFSCEKISVEAARVLCAEADEIGSAIGHQGAAEAIELLLGVKCPVNRVDYVQPMGETVIALKLKSRMPEGCGNLTLEVMEQIGFVFYRIERIQCYCQG